MKHGCEDDEKPNDAKDEEEKDNVPAMQKNGKAGNNNVPDDSKAEQPKDGENLDQNAPEQAQGEEEKPLEEILPSLKKILEDDQLRALIQKIIDEDKKEAPSPVPVTGPAANLFDPTEQRDRAHTAFIVRVPPPKYDEKGFSIRSGSRQKREFQFGTKQENEEEEESEDPLKVQQEIFAQKVSNQSRIVPPFKSKRFGNRSISIAP